MAENKLVTGVISPYRGKKIHLELVGAHLVVGLFHYWDDSNNEACNQVVFWNFWISQMIEAI